MTPAQEQRFWSRADRIDDGCWIWTAGKTRGYGRAWIGNKPVYAHRLAYELAVGPIPSGQDLDHLCRNHSCVRPTHLEPVSRRENLMRGDTLTRAHHEGRDCGFAKCPSCRRSRRPLRLVLP